MFGLANTKRIRPDAYDNQHRQFGIAPSARARIDLAQSGAELAHQWPREAISQRGKRVGIGQRLTRARGRDQQGFEVIEVERHRVVP